MTEVKFNIQIQLATAEDAPLIATVLYQSFAEYKSAYTREAFDATTPPSEEIQERMSEGPIWVATHDTRIVGTVSVVPRGGALYLRGMAVHPSTRGVRVGELLLTQVEYFASENHYKRLFLSTTPFLEHAIRLYRRMGFQQNNEGPHDLHGTPLFTMVKELG